MIGAVTAVEKPRVLDAAGPCVPAPWTVPPAAVVHVLEELEPGNLAELSLGP